MELVLCKFIFLNEKMRMIIFIYEYMNDRGYIYYLLLLVYDMIIWNDFFCIDEEIKNRLYFYKKIFLLEFVWYY